VKVVAALVALAAVLPMTARAQKCPYAAAYYVVRGEDGMVLDEAELKTVREQSLNPIGDDNLRMFLGTLSRRADGKYRHGQLEGARIPVLDFHGDGCVVRLAEITLVYRQRRMRLIFDVDLGVSFGQADDFGRRPTLIVVESLPFQEGTFRLDLRGWLAQLKRFGEWSEDGGWPTIPAEFWKDARGTG